MNLTLERVIFTPRTTAGTLLVDGQFECFTLEDLTRAKGVKVYGQTAIPYGSYDIELRKSPSHNHRLMPYLRDVPMFEGIMIHIGNTLQDTLGCILVGNAIRQDRVEESTIAYQSLFPKIFAATQRNERVVINIFSDPPEFHL